jgi:hypothetical protein
MVDSYRDEHARSPYRHHSSRQRTNGFFRASCEKIPRRDMTDRLLLPYPFDDEHPRLSGSVLEHERKAFHDAFNASVGCLRAGGRFLPLPVCQLRVGQPNL